MVSQIPLWSMGRNVGGPAFQQTVRHLSRRYRIALVQPELDYVGNEDLPENVELHTFRHRFHGALRHVPKLGWVADTLGWYSFGWSAWPVVRTLCERGDVSLVYGYEIYGAPVARRAASAFGLPLVTRFQGTLMSQRRYMPLSNLRFWKHVRGLATPADLVIMTNDGTQGAEYLRSLGHPLERIRFWMNGFDRDIEQFAVRDVREELGIPAGAPLLLTVSRLSNWKRVDRSVNALAALRARGLDAWLVVVGVGPERSRLENLASGLGIADRVVFAGAVPRGSLASYYRSADLVLSLYDFSNLANPVIEAMVLGAPVLAYEVGGTSELVKDGVNGLLTPDADDAVGLAGLLGRLLQDEEGLRRLGASARTWALDNVWTWQERMQVEADDLDSLIHPGSRTAHSPERSSTVE